MDEKFTNNLESNKYFRSLPTYVQETIKQSGAKFADEQELRNSAENLMNFR